MIDPKDRTLSLVRQCGLVGIARSSYYYEGKGESPLNLHLMRLIDEKFMEAPYYGSRQMARHMQREGHKCGRRHAESAPLAHPRKRASGATCATADEADGEG